MIRPYSLPAPSDYRHKFSSNPRRIAQIEIFTSTMNMGRKEKSAQLHFKSIKRPSGSSLQDDHSPGSMEKSAGDCIDQHCTSPVLESYSVSTWLCTAKRRLGSGIGCCHSYPFVLRMTDLDMHDWVSCFPLI